MNTPRCGFSAVNPARLSLRAMWISVTSKGHWHSFSFCTDTTRFSSVHKVGHDSAAGLKSGKSEAQNSRQLLPRPAEKISRGPSFPVRGRKERFPQRLEYYKHRSAGDFDGEERPCGIAFDGHYLHIRRAGPRFLQKPFPGRRRYPKSCRPPESGLVAEKDRTNFLPGHDLLAFYRTREDFIGNTGHQGAMTFNLSNRERILVAL